MIEQEEQKNEQDDEQDPQDRKWERAERMLDELRSGWSISIIRMRPGWCSGFLERIECSDDEPIDIDYIVQTWGGEVLRLRLSDETGTYRRGATVNLRSYPPLFRGEPIRRNDHTGPVDDRRRARQQNDAYVPPPPAPAQLDLIGVLGLLQKTRKEDLGLLRALFGSVPQFQPHEQRSSLDDLLEYATKWKQLQKIFGSDQSAQPATDEGQLLGSITEIVKAIGARPAQPATPAQPPGRIVAPRENPKPIDHGTNVPQIEHNNDLSAVISRLDHNDFTNLILTSLASMPDDRRERAIATFFERSGFFEDDDRGDDEPEENDEQPDFPQHP